MKLEREERFICEGSLSLGPDMGGMALRQKRIELQIIGTTHYLCGRESEFSQNHRMAWFGQDLKDHLVSTSPTMGRDTLH